MPLGRPNDVIYAGHDVWSGLYLNYVIVTGLSVTGFEEPAYSYVCLYMDVDMIG